MSGATLTEVLEGYAVATPGGNDPEVLGRWIREYPQFADDLIDFAAARAEHRAIDARPFGEEDRSAEIGLNILKEQLRPREFAVPESLTAMAERKGWKKPEFAKRSGLSMSLLMYLEKRRLRFSTIPTKLIARLAELLETSEQAIAGYLALPPTTAGEANFKTPTRPDEVRQRDFADAVREDQALSAEEKRALLSE